MLYQKILILSISILIQSCGAAKRRGRESETSPKDAKEQGSGVFPSDPKLSTLMRDAKKDGQIVCTAFKEAEGNLKLNLTGDFNYEDMLRLMTWSQKYDLKSGKKTLKLDPKISWKREILESIVNIFKKGCPTEYVPTAFVNIVKEVGMIYLNSGKDSTNNMNKWNKTLTTLKSCSEKVQMLRFTSDGFQVSDLYFKDKDGNEELMNIEPPEEEADDMFEYVDQIVDPIWWFFSFSFGSCYPNFETKAIALAEFKKLFYNDFLIELTTRWKFGGRWTMGYGPIFGDMNIEQILINLRFCVTAAYEKNMIGDRQLVRPLSLEFESERVLPILNRKTGNPLL